MVCNLEVLLWKFGCKHLALMELELAQVNINSIM